MDTSVAGSYEDLGGPTPENSKLDDDSNKLKTPATLKQVKDVVNQRCKTYRSDVRYEGRGRVKKKKYLQKQKPLKRK